MEELISEYLTPATATDNGIRSAIERRSRTLAYYRTLNIEEAIDGALGKLAFINEGQRARETHFDHIRHNAIENATEPLRNLIPLLKRANSFMEIWSLVNEQIYHIFGTGNLFVYDTALRIALTFQNNGMLPLHVFLHSDPLKSAYHFGIRHPKNQPYVERIMFEEICGEFRNMQSHEIENFLCIYKDQILNL